jgi:hypothetical protein
MLYGLQHRTHVGQDSIVGVVTHYGLDSPGTESQWGEIFHVRPDRPRGPTSLLYNGYWVSFQGANSWGVALTTHPHLVIRLKKE